MSRTRVVDLVLTDSTVFMGTELCRLSVCLIVVTYMCRLFRWWQTRVDLLAWLSSARRTGFVVASR